MRRIGLGVAISALLIAQARAADEHAVQGILLQVDAAKNTIVVSCDAIPNYMDAMEMPFTVREPDELKRLTPGTTIRFTMVEENGRDYAEHVKTVAVTNYESEPTTAGRLTILHRTLNPAAAARIVQVGKPVPDFALTDQAGQTTNLSQFKGKVVALTFGYARCPNPNYCFRLSNNLAQIKRRFQSVVGRDLMLVTIVVDPAEDRGKALEGYADTWRADPAAWRFLTGSVADVKAAAELFGMNFWSDEGFMTHSFHTVVIDREGRLAANLEGNQFSADQLGDLVETVLNRPDGENKAERSAAHP
ncbi:SCO family protein [Occallatibacter riparius]|uniref:SCO family protein n=1 Tax=Occallatibacter riparius TaxID=1002689 RepID=A0A9J7BPI9_9BACT|nr:SCO family protein [Occallatibacter riparius]UWZ84519.1 SCO family protein [Occallatibacter riparius]